MAVNTEVVKQGLKQLTLAREAARTMVEYYTDYYPESWLQEEAEQSEKPMARESWKASTYTLIDEALMRAAGDIEKGDLPAASDILDRASAGLMLRLHKEKALHFVPAVLALLGAAETLKATPQALSSVEGKHQLKNWLGNVVDGLPDELIKRDSFMLNQEDLEVAMRRPQQEMAAQSYGATMVVKELSDEQKNARILNFLEASKADDSVFLTNYFAAIALKMQQILAKGVEKGQSPPPF